MSMGPGEVPAVTDRSGATYDYEYDYDYDYRDIGGEEPGEGAS